MTMRDPGYDETDMTPTEFEAIMAEGTPADISPPLAPAIIVTRIPVETGSSGDTRREDVRLVADRDQTIRESRALAGT